MLAVILDAPQAEHAQRAVTELITLLLLTVQPLHGWNLVTVEVEPHGLDSPPLAQQLLSQ